MTLSDQMKTEASTQVDKLTSEYHILDASGKSSTITLKLWFSGFTSAAMANIGVYSDQLYIAFTFGAKVGKCLKFATKQVLDIKSPENEGRRFSHCMLPDYSYLSASSGSTFVARRAGIQQATKATTISSSESPTNVSGSVALTPNSKPFISRVRANAPLRPITCPPHRIILA